MLRSIFSLFQNIIDSEREFKNTKSSTVIYLVSNPDNTVNMELEIDGKERENLRSVKENSERSESFQITTEQGDTVTCKHLTDKKIRAKPGNKDEGKLELEYKEMVEKMEERTTFSNDEILENVEPQEVGEEGERMRVRDLLAQLPERHAKMVQKDRDQIIALMDQIQKMKKGMERLQEIAQQFNCSEKFKQDVDYLVRNVGPALQQSQAEHKNLSPKKL